MLNTASVVKLPAQGVLQCITYARTLVNQMATKNRQWAASMLTCREKDGFTQVWKAEEGDLDSPRLQKQREQLPQLQKDPLQLQLKMDALIVEVKADTPLLEVWLLSIRITALVDECRCTAQLLGEQLNILSRQFTATPCLLRSCLTPVPGSAAVGVPPPLPILQPSMTDALAKLNVTPHPAGLATVMKLLAAPEWGNVVLNGGLPPVGTKDLPPPYQTWFNRLYIRVSAPRQRPCTSKGRLC